MTARSSRRIVLVERPGLFADSLEVVLRREGFDVRRPDVHAAGIAVAATIKAILGLRPGLVLLDLELGGHGDGLSLIAPLVRAGTAVVIVTGSPNRRAAAVALGAREVFDKDESLPDVLARLRRLAHGHLS